MTKILNSKLVIMLEYHTEIFCVYDVKDTTQIGDLSDLNDEESAGTFY